MEKQAVKPAFLTTVSVLRALHLLKNLKVLVEEPRKKDEEEVEKDEDEGRYSSSSTEEQTPS